jgi:GTP-binding protein Era
MSEDQQNNTGSRCGFYAIIGAPNAGKSTLVNTLVGAKVAIVTHKVQTTRTKITGIGLYDNTQLVFIDTPGIFQPKRRLDRAMVNAAWQGADDAETVILMVDARKGLTDDVERIVQSLKDNKQSAVLVLNKIDLIKRDSLLGLAHSLNEAGFFSETFMISALNGNGVEDLKKHLASLAPEGPWMYPEDQISDVTMRNLAAEITREKVFLRLHDELPYGATVETEKWEERPDGSVRIEQVLHVQRETHKGIAIGKGGAMLKQIGQMAREEMTEAFDCKVHLFLHVRVSERWADDKSVYEDMGLDFVD